MNIIDAVEKELKAVKKTNLDIGLSILTQQALILYSNKDLQLSYSIYHLIKNVLYLVVE